MCTYVNIYEAFKINMVPKEARPAEDQGKAIRQREEKMQNPWGNSKKAGHTGLSEARGEL